MITILKRIYIWGFRYEATSALGFLFYSIYVSALSLAYRVRFRSVLRETRDRIRTERKDILLHQRSAFVFANGPSMLDIDLQKISRLCNEREFDLIAINSFLSKSAHSVKPRFAIFADNQHFLYNYKEINEDINTCEALGIPYFVPAKYVNGDGMLGYCSLCDINSSNTSDLTKPTGFHGQTCFFALTLAKMLGYKNIYICGFDNSYFKDFEVADDGRMMISHRHYYDSNEANVEVPCIYGNTSEFFFDIYRHFRYLEKITSSSPIINIAKKSYLSTVPRNFSLDVYKN